MRHQSDCDISHLLVGPVRKVLEGLVVERKHLRRLTCLGLVAGVRAVRDKAKSKRRGLILGIGRRQPEPSDQDAIEPAAAILQRTAVPLDRQIHFEFYHRCLGIIWLDMTEHLAEFRIGGRDSSPGVGARSKTEDDEGACRAPESIRTASRNGPARPAQVAAGSPTIVAAGTEETPARTARTPAIQARALAMVSDPLLFVAAYPADDRHSTARNLAMI